jgi:hypothetical protein
MNDMYLCNGVGQELNGLLKETLFLRFGDEVWLHFVTASAVVGQWQFSELHTFEFI